VSPVPPGAAAPLPPPGELLDGARAVAVPLRTRFRGLTVRHALLLRGPCGWAEFAPFDDYSDAAAARWLAAAVEAGWVGWPAPVRQAVPVNAIVPAVGARDVAGLLDRAGGCTTVKVKVAEVSQGLADDVERVAAVREWLGPAGRVRVDANGAWTLDQARQALAALAPFGLEYAEQPCASLAEMAQLRREVSVPLAADEGLRRADDPTAVAGLAEACDVVVVKAAPLGGVAAALRVAASTGRPAVVSSALDTSVGLAGGLALAAALPQLGYACGLGTGALLADDVTTAPLVPRDGQLAVREVTVDDAALDRLAAGADRVSWWVRRLYAAHQVLAA